MPRPKKSVPKYCLHKASGRAVVRIDGRDHYLGPHGSAESWDAYHRLIAEWTARQRERAESPAPAGITRAASTQLTVVEVIHKYWTFAKTYYVRDGQPTAELIGMKYSVKPVRELYGRTLASEFGPLALKAVREHLIAQDLCRTEINKRVGRIKRAFKWAVSEELVLASVYHGLLTVVGLRQGRTSVRESKSVKPVPDKDVEATLPFLAPPVRAMVQLQRLTGMRPGEVVQIRSGAIDRSGPVWLYEPENHKNQWRGHHRVVPLGPQAQELLLPFLDRPDDAFLFSPKEAEQWRREHRPASSQTDRKTPIYPCELRARERRKQQRRQRQRKRPPRDHYDRDSYRRAIEYGLKKARKAGIAIAHWHPHQLRHTRATELRKQFGIEAAQVSLGHARADVTEVYAEKNIQRAIEIAAQTG